MFKCKLMQLFLMKLQLGRQTVIIRRIKFRCFISTLPIVIRVQERNRGYYMAAQRYEISLRVLKNIPRVSAANG